MTKYLEVIKISKNGCMPCMALGYAFSANQEEIEATGATVTNINISETPEDIEKYDVSGVPLLIFKRNGMEIGRITGGVSIEEVLDAIENAKKG